jgi:REP element-mobilizing transposase RayT
MRHRIYLHITWTTRDRAPLIDRAVAEFVQLFLPTMARQERAAIVELGLVDNHVHAIVRAHPNTRLPRLVQRFKGAGARLANKKGIATQSLGLRWAKGYNIESVGPRALDAARGYVRSQALCEPSDEFTRSPPFLVRPPTQPYGVISSAVESASPLKRNLNVP